MNVRNNIIDTQGNTISRIVVDGGEESDVLSHSARYVLGNLRVNPFRQLLDVQQLVLVDVSSPENVFQ